MYTILKCNHYDDLTVCFAWQVPNKTQDQDHISFFVDTLQSFPINGILNRNEVLKNDREPNSHTNHLDKVYHRKQPRQLHFPLQFHGKWFPGKYDHGCNLLNVPFPKYRTENNCRNYKF